MIRAITISNVSLDLQIYEPDGVFGAPARLRHELEAQRLEPKDDIREGGRLRVRHEATPVHHAARRRDGAAARGASATMPSEAGTGSVFTVRLPVGPHMQ
jgi:hypothetical protein